MHQSALIFNFISITQSKFQHDVIDSIIRETKKINYITADTLRTKIYSGKKSSKPDQYCKMHSLLVTCQVSISFASLHVLQVDPHTISFIPFFTVSHETLPYDYINFTFLCCSSLRMITWTKCSHIFGQNVCSYSPSLPVFHLFLQVSLGPYPCMWVHKVTLPVCHTPCHGRAASMLSPGNEGIPFAQGKQH